MTLLELSTLELAVVGDLDQYREQFQAWQKPKIKKSLDLALMIKVNPERGKVQVETRRIHAHQLQSFHKSIKSTKVTKRLSLEIAYCWSVR